MYNLNSELAPTRRSTEKSNEPKQRNILKGCPCRVPVNSLTLDARRCAVGQALFNVCFSVPFSV